MRSWSIAALGCLFAAGSALLVGQAALVASRDLSALYWILTGAVALRASIALAET